MIDPQVSRSRSARRLWAGHVRHLFQAMDLDERAGASDISESLAAFCEQHPHMPSHTLSILMARSFCATGDYEAAGRILHHDRAHRAHAGPWLSALSAEYPFPELYPLFSTRALRPLTLKTVRAEAVWVLDLDKIHLTDADRHEMILLKTLRVLTEKVSNVWKKSEGRGALVVKGLPRVTHFMNSRCKTTAGPDAVRYLQAVLQHRAANNSWTSVPSVLLLDL